MIATVAPDGTPNVTYLSQVYYVDEAHVALSCQFFNKTQQNVVHNPHACVIVYDPVTFEAYRMEVRFEHAEVEGPLFDTMAMRIQTIASHAGMIGVFKLRSADVYKVDCCERLDDFIVVPETPALDDPGGRSELRALQVVSQRVARIDTLNGLFEGLLESLEQTLGIPHGMFLLYDDAAEILRVTAARGYPAGAVGTEILLGEGFIGAVAKERRQLRLCGTEGDLRYGRAIRSQHAQIAGRRGLTHELPPCGLPDAQSQLAVPLIAGDRLLGVLALESRERLGFDDWDEAFVEIVSNQVAARLEQLCVAAPVNGAPAVQVQSDAPGPGLTRRFRFFPDDDCVFVDDDYLIRNLPGRILWKLLRTHVKTGRTEFSNRELRLDPWLGLPPIRDNLESRLALLRKRLTDKCPELTVASTKRGYFRLASTCQIVLEESEGRPQSPQAGP